MLQNDGAFAQELQVQNKTCSHCSENKPIQEFSYRNTENRYESKCKVCRKTLKKQQSHSKLVAVKSPMSPKQTTIPEGTIEPKANMTNALMEVIDFTDLEENHGKTLDHFEKHDSVQRFNEFITLLREGYADLAGYKRIYVR